MSEGKITSQHYRQTACCAKRQARKEKRKAIRANRRRFFVAADLFFAKIDKKNTNLSVLALSELAVETHSIRNDVEAEQARLGGEEEKGKFMSEKERQKKKEVPQQWR